MIKDPVSAEALPRTLRDGPVVNPWERRERQAAAQDAPRTDGATTTGVVAQGSIVNRALTWMQDHDAPILADPLAGDPATVRAAIQRAVMALNLRRFEADALTEQHADIPCHPYYGGIKLTIESLLSSEFWMGLSFSMGVSMPDWYIRGDGTQMTKLVCPFKF